MRFFLFDLVIKLSFKDVLLRRGDEGSVHLFEFKNVGLLSSGAVSAVSEV